MTRVFGAPCQVRAQLTIYIFNCILTSVSTAAHDMIPDLYSFLVKNKCILKHKTQDNEIY
jgi:hypothetical protein